MSGKEQNGHLHSLLEIFFGLAIASGLEQVAPRLFGYDATPPSVLFGSAQWWMLLWMSLIAFAVAVGQWLAAFDSTVIYRHPLPLLMYIGGITLMFCLFAGAGDIVVFLGVLMTCCWYFVSAPFVRRWSQGDPIVTYDPMWFRWFRAVVATTICVCSLARLVNSTVLMTVATVLAIWSWCYVWKKFSETLRRITGDVNCSSPS